MMKKLQILLIENTLKFLYLDVYTRVKKLLRKRKKMKRRMKKKLLKIAKNPGNLTRKCARDMFTLKCAAA